MDDRTLLGILEDGDGDRLMILESGKGVVLCVVPAGDQTGPAVGMSWDNVSDLVTILTSRIQRRFN